MSNATEIVSICTGRQSSIVLLQGRSRQRSLRYWLPMVTLLVLLSVKAEAGTRPVPDSIPAGLPAGLVTPPKIYAAPRITRAITIDGRLEDPAWQTVPWSDLFVDISGSSRIKTVHVDSPAEIMATRVKLCWDDQYLYVAASLKDPDLWATLRQRDTIIYHNNDFEVFFTTGPEVTSYYEVEINQLGTLLDLFMPRPYRNGGRAMIQWDLKGLKSAVHLYGTLDQPGDQDSCWTLEMAIPFKGVLAFGQRLPQAGSYWRINFSRVQWELAAAAKGYSRKESDGRLLPEHNWVWSPQGIVNMHAPDRWGYLFFTGGRGEQQDPPVLPLVERQKARLWKLYYLEQSVFARRQKFALTLGELGISSNEVQLTDPATGKAVNYKIALAAGAYWFRVALLQLNGEEVLALDQNGLMGVPPAKDPE